MERLPVRTAMERAVHLCRLRLSIRLSMLVLTARQLEKEGHDLSAAFVAGKNQGRGALSGKCCRVTACRHKRLYHPELAEFRGMVHSSPAIVICFLKVVLAPMLNQPQRDGGLLALDGIHDGRQPVIAPPFLQHRPVRPDALLHRLQVVVLDVAEDQVPPLMPSVKLGCGCHGCDM